MQRSWLVRWPSGFVIAPTEQSVGHRIRDPLPCALGPATRGVDAADRRRRAPSAAGPGARTGAGAGGHPGAGLRQQQPWVVSVLAYRLEALIPPSLPAVPAARPVRRPDPFQSCDGCDRAFRSPTPAAAATARPRCTRPPEPGPPGVDVLRRPAASSGCRYACGPRAWSAVRRPH